MDLRNAPLCGSSELFPKGAFEKAVERSSRVLHSKAIKKVMSLEKLVKKFQFSQAAHQSEPTKEVPSPSSQSRGKVPWS